MAISVRPGQWFLVNASPDLAAQINFFPELHPSPDSTRNSPIAGVFLTNADLDHVLGLFALREGGRLDIVAPKAIQQPLAGPLGLNTVLDSFCGVTWHEPQSTFSSGEESNLRYRAIALPGGPPLYASNLKDGPHSVAYQFLDTTAGGKLLVAPDVAAVNPELLAALKDSDAILFDGTFWSNDDLAKVRPGTRTPEQMGHVTIKDGSLDLLVKLPAKRKIYTHINNTNSILSPQSPERAAVEAAGITVGQDGIEFEL